MFRLVGLTCAIAALATATHAAPARAVYSKTYDACMAKAETTLAMEDCNNGELTIRNKALNAAYAAALARVGDAAAAFKAAERAWIAYRDADCGVYENRGQFGTLGAIEAGDCLIDRTIERTKALQTFALDPSQPG